MAVPVAGRKRFKGTLEGYHDGEVRLFIENPEGATKEPVLIGVPFADIGEAKLVLTDATDRSGPSRLPVQGLWRRRRDRRRPDFAREERRQWLIMA